MSKFVPDRRSLIVLGSLLAAMTVVSGLLLMLEPGGGFQSTWRLSLASLEDTRPNAKEQLFGLASGVEMNRWSGVVIHRGSQADAVLARYGDPLRSDKSASRGYHFWIESTLDGQDGRIRISPQWRDQRYLNQQKGSGDPMIRISLAPAEAGKIPSDRQIRSLLWLVHRLQQRCHVPAGRVVLEQGSGLTSDPNRSDRDAWLFPVAQFRQQLLTLAGS